MPRAKMVPDVKMDPELKAYLNESASLRNDYLSERITFEQYNQLSSKRTLDRKTRERLGIPWIDPFLSTLATNEASGLVNNFGSPMEVRVILWNPPKTRRGWSQGWAPGRPPDLNLPYMPYFSDQSMYQARPWGRGKSGGIDIALTNPPSLTRLRIRLCHELGHFVQDREEARIPTPVLHELDAIRRGMRFAVLLRVVRPYVVGSVQYVKDVLEMGQLFGVEGGIDELSRGYLMEFLKEYNKE